MPSMTKRVNVYAQVAVRNINPPIYGTCKDIVMTTGDILKCLCKRARVDEILPDGSIVHLNMRNYYTDNGAGLDAKKNIKKEEKKITEEQPARFKVPVAPSNEAQVVETNEIEIIEDTIPEEVVSEPENANNDIVTSGYVSIENTSEEVVGNTTTVSTDEEDVAIDSIAIESTEDEAIENITEVATDDTTESDATPQYHNNKKRNRNRNA